MRERINAALKAAIKAQDKRAMSTLRLMNAAIEDRVIAARSNGQEGLSDAEVLQILAKMIKQRRESITAFEEGGRLELAQQEREEIDIIQSFMPEPLSEEETRKVCEKLVKELGCDGRKDIGRTMGALKERYAGEMDFGKASQIVKELLK
jgi:hypothetical protein